MSMQTGLATSTTQLRSYAPATDVSVAAPAPQLDIARAGPVAAGRNPRTEPGPIRFIIIALAIAFLSIFVVLPLVLAPMGIAEDIRPGARAFVEQPGLCQAARRDAGGGRHVGRRGQFRGGRPAEVRRV